jgi:hypothetical protein
MIGIIVQLVLSWIVIWLYCKGNLSVLGLMPTTERVRDLFVFLLVTMLACSSGFLLRMYFGQEKWLMNPGFTWKLLFEGAWWNMKSVLFEELIFRGVLLYILIKWLGHVRAIIISSVAFGIYHWFSYELFGNPGQMIVIFLLTGSIGLLYAYGFAKTGALYATIAMHFGWNFTKGFIFSEGATGNGILVQAKPLPNVQVSYFVYAIVILTPFVLFFLLNFLLLKNRAYRI